MACVLIPLAIALLASGPIALIISIVTLNRVKRLEDKTVLSLRAPETTIPVSPRPAPQPTSEPFKEQPTPEPFFKPVSVPTAEKIPAVSPVSPTMLIKPVAPPAPLEKPPMPATQIIIESAVEKAKKEAVSLEQRIGTRWVLIAGVITVFISAGFFLKFAYEHHWIGPWGRIGIAAFAGVVSLAIGEITRRRGYDIAAKGTTALGFAILYAADFAAYRFYELIGSVPAFSAAIVITAAAMAYAVMLNEVVAAFLALLGGFATPVLVSKGENMPVPLFGYVLVLSVGAMLCAFWRKWRSVNLLAFIGTFALYCGWFEKFFRSQLHGEGPPEQLAIALGWLVIFFGVYLVLPLLYGLANRAVARKDDVWLVVINASWTFYYLWTLLFEHYQISLAFCAAGLSAAHLAMMGLVFVRCRQDEVLRRTLLVIGLAFLTTAIPMYWQMNAAIIGWAVEGAVLIYVGIRYRSVLTQFGAVAALTLACAKLLWQLPLHTEPFRLVLNPALGVWVFVAAALWFCHFLYKKDSRSPEDLSGIITQIFYATAVIVLFSAATLEWAAHCKYNLLAGNDLHYISRGQSVIFAAAALLFAIRPVCPRGRATSALNIIALIAGAAFVVYALTRLHIDKFLIFANWDFAAIFVFIMATLGCHIKYRLTAESYKSEEGIDSQTLYALFGTLLIVAIGAEWYWHCMFNLQTSFISTELVRGQIIVFSAGVLGFAVRPLCPRGILSKLWSSGLAIIGSFFTVILYSSIHKQPFHIFANWTFAATGVLVIAMFASAYLLNRRKDEEPQGYGFAVGIFLLAVTVLWVVLSEEIYEYWRCRNLYVIATANWFFIASMWISVAWAIYGLVLLAGGFWQKVKMLRYFGLCVFGVLLLKAFVIDMSDVSTIYRIMAFLATGVTLVGVSYLYQFIKKKGFFEVGVTKN